MFLPQHDYWLCLATGGVSPGLPIDCQSVPIRPGRHRIVLQQRATKDGWRVTVSSDDAVILTLDEPKSWCDGFGPGLSSDGVKSRTEEFDPERQVVLFRCLFPDAHPVGGATPRRFLNGAGIALWIQPTPIPRAGSESPKSAK